MAESKTLTLGETAAYKIVQQSTDAANTTFIAVGSGQDNEAKLTTSVVQITDSTNTTKLEPNKVTAGNVDTYLSGTVTDGLQLASDVSLKKAGGANKNLVLSSGNAQLSIVHSDNNTDTVGPQQQKTELHFTGGDSGHSGYIPILDGNHMIPTEYLSNAFAFDGKLIFRHHIYLEYDSNASGDPYWKLTDAMTSTAGKTSWYGNAKADLDPTANADGSTTPDTDKYWNYAFATGSYFLVNFDTSGLGVAQEASLLPAHVTLGQLLTLLANAGLLDQYNGSGTSWYNGTTSDSFVVPSQGTNYKVSQSDMIVIRNKTYAAALPTANDWVDKIEVTVIDNSDEFQKRLVNANELKFPTITANTLHITSTEMKGSTSGVTSFSSSSEADAAIVLNASAGGIDVDAIKSINLTSDEAQADAIRLEASNAAGGVDIDAGTAGVDVDAKEGAIALDVTNSSDASVGHVGITSTGQLDLDSSSIVDIVSSGPAAATHATSAGTFDVTPAVHVSSTGGVGVKATKDFVVISESANAKAFDFYATNASGGVNFKTGGSAKFRVDAGSDGVDVDTTGAFAVDAEGAAHVISSASTAKVQGATTATLQAGSGDAEVKSTSAGVLLQSGQAAVDAIKLDATNVDGGIQLVAGMVNSSAISLDAEAGGVSIDGSTGVVINASDSGDTELKSAAGSVLVEANESSAAGAIKLNAAGTASGIQAVSTGAFLVDAGTTATLDGATGVLVDASTSGDAEFKSSARDVKLTASSETGSVLVTAGKADAAAFKVSATGGAADLDTRSVQLGRSDGSFSSIRLRDNSVLSMNQMRVSGALKSSVSGIGAIQMQLEPYKLGSASEMYQIDVKICAKDGQGSGAAKLAYISASLIYKFSATSENSGDRTASVSVEKYFIDGDVAFEVGTYNSTDTNTDHNGNLRIYSYFTGTARAETPTDSADFQQGGRWQVSYDIIHTFNDNSTFGNSDHAHTKFVGFDNTGATDTTNNEIGRTISSSQTFSDGPGSESHYSGVGNLQSFS